MTWWIWPPGFDSFPAGGRRGRCTWWRFFEEAVDPSMRRLGDLLQAVMRCCLQLCSGDTEKTEQLYGLATVLGMSRFGCCVHRPLANLLQPEVVAIFYSRKIQVAAAKQPAAERRLPRGWPGARSESSTGRTDGKRLNTCAAVLQGRRLLGRLDG